MSETCAGSTAERGGSDETSIVDGVSASPGAGADEVRPPSCGLRGLAAFLGDLGAFVAFCSAALASRAACSSGDGTFSLMFSFRTPAAKLSISSPSASAWLRDSLDENALGTLGTGGAFLGLADRFGVALVDLRAPADGDRLAAVPGREVGCPVLPTDGD